jgi:hypothetical protein
MTSLDSLTQVGQGRTVPITVTLTEGTLAAAREIAGPRGTSSLVERALARELRRLALASMVEDYERDNGVITPEEVAVQNARLAAAR